MSEPPSAYLKKKITPTSSPRRGHSASSTPKGKLKQDENGRKRYFTNDIRALLFGFGEDSDEVYKETIDLIEELVSDFVIKTAREAADIGRPGKISIDDLLYLIRNDSRKSSRAIQLVRMNEQIKEAKKQFDDEKELLD